MLYRTTWLISLFTLILSGCQQKQSSITNLSMLEGGATIAVPTGTVADQFVLDRFPDAEIVYFNSVLDCALAVKDGKADAAAYDKPILKNIASKQEGLTVLDELLIEDEYGFAVRPDDRELKNAIDETLAELKANGTYEEMQKRWFPDSGEPGPMPKIENEGKNGVLRFGTAAVTEPMSYYNAKQEVVGFDVEFAAYIAQHLGMKLKIVDMEFGGLLPALISGKIDMAGAGMSITEERAKMVLFSECYYPSGIAAIVRTAENQDNTLDESDLLSIDNIDDKKMGTMLGSIHGKYARENYPDAKILQFQTVSDMLTAIKAQKIDVAFFEDASLSEVTSNHSEIGALKRNLFTAPIAAAFNPQNDKLKAQYNTFLKEIKANGVYDDVYSRWIEQKLREQPEITVNSPDGKLTVGISSDVGFPYMGMKDGRYIGFDVELAQRFASYLGKEFVLADMPFSSLIAALSSGKIDLIHSSMMITDERKEKVDFSDVYFESGSTIIALNKRIKGNNDIIGSNESQQQNKSFFKSLSTSFYNNIVRENRYKLILNGLKVTSIITLLAALLGTIIGSLLCFLRMSKNKVTANVTSLLIDLIRGTPVLVFLMITFYVIFASVNIDPVIVAVIAFGINFGAYVSEMFRSAIGSIDPGQREAGIASGFTKTQTFIHIILPQALQRVLPVYKGEFISLLKMTSIVGYIAVQDLTKASDIIRSRTFDAFFPLIMAAVIYIALAALLTWGLSFIEVSVDPKRRKIKKTVEGSL
ncbi:MAG: ABC transporter permease subunit [Prolixibacteraceae bacterium]|nr:ABC transporter permease subunit [Prolixibacteraceae bacterium]MBN2649057.1 ABC transporter permease subunit [Prolixibacteraceae bacterium]